MRGVIEKTWGWDEEWQGTDLDRRWDAYLVSVVEAEGRQPMPWSWSGYLIPSTFMNCK